MGFGHSNFQEIFENFPEIFENFQGPITLEQLPAKCKAGDPTIADVENL